MKKDNDLVAFQGRKVKKEWRDAYMDGYRNPYSVSYKYDDNKYNKAAYSDGQIAGGQDNCMEGTF